MAAPAKDHKKPIEDPVLAELKGIKRLFMLFLMKAGATQEELGLALDLDQSTISKMIPKSKVEKFPREK